ncbi:MAG: hypothetical protein K9K67_09880 [Bacteriovoracaceae bacterium]|nr:hypothetical protein [Bacteriovoracaceae bacterium]
MPTSFDHKMICEFASKDKERSHLNTVYFDEVGVAVSTDGHRLFACKSLFTHDHKGKVFDIYELAKNNIWNEVNEKYPDWKLLLDGMDPDNYRTSFSLKIPKWFSNFKGDEEKTLFTIDFSDSINPKIVSGNFQDDLSFGVDGRYLAPFSGQEITAHVDNGVTPVIITQEKELKFTGSSSLNYLKDLPWFALIMPIKLDPLEVSDRANNVVFV